VGCDVASVRSLGEKQDDDDDDAACNLREKGNTWFHFEHIMPDMSPYANKLQVQLRNKVYLV
jgi:hypothetical protein